MNATSASSTGRTSDVVVVGAGAVGIATALELAQRGAAVTVLERGPRPASGSSHGNAGVVGPAHVLPLASVQAVRDGLRWMLRRNSPFSLAPRPALRQERTSRPATRTATRGERAVLARWERESGIAFAPGPGGIAIGEHRRPRAYSRSSTTTGILRRVRRW
ncbi:MAG: FAD-dependent oxidoreductase [Actinobacteria bacterium]|nr:FAD-dependent oxidoreductase [Actinomycetota bacterium]